MHDILLWPTNNSYIPSKISRKWSFFFVRKQSCVKYKYSNGNFVFSSRNIVFNKNISINTAQDFLIKITIFEYNKLLFYYCCRES